MSQPSRALPDRPNLRYLKIEAKRRRAAGEFSTLHEAQLAIAREHGRPSWAALKEEVERPALAHVRWVTARFRDAGRAAWVAPGEAELREHFDDRYLALVPVERLVATLTGVAGRLRSELVVARATPDRLRAEVAGLRIEAAAGPQPPHRLTLLRMYPVGGRVRDPRVQGPTGHTHGPVPEGAAEVAEESYAELGLVGLALAGTDESGQPWTVVRGWADLDRREELRPEHRFPVYGISKVITAVAVLRLVAEGRLDLDGPTAIRHLLSHDGYPSLGHLIAEVTGRPYPEAVAELVLGPAGMDASGFPAAWPERDAVTGYHLSDDGTFATAPRAVSPVPAAGGLWSTPADLARFGRTWPSLLPEPLVRAALHPEATQPSGAAQVGLGWLLNEAQGVYGHPGAGPGAGASLLIRRGTGAAVAVCANRLVPVEPVAARLAGALTRRP